MITAVFAAAAAAILTSGVLWILDHATIIGDGPLEFDGLGHVTMWLAALTVLLGVVMYATP